MKTPFLAALLALIPAPFDAPERRATSIAFHPEEGLELSKEFDMSVEVDLDEMTVLVDGEEAALDGMEASMRFEERVVVTDSYVAMGDGRPEKLRRTFDVLTSSETSSGSLSEPTEEVGASDLEGETVLFEWDDDEEEFVPSFEDSEADEALLEELEEDMDLRGFLPEDEVEEGDSWEFEAVEMERLLELGGDLGIETAEEEEEEEEDDMDRAMDEVFENLDGTITCTYTGDREEDSRSIATITIAGEFSGSADAEDDSGSVTVTFDLEGQLDWDLEGGRFVAFELGGDIDIEFEFVEEDMTMNMSMDGEITMSGTAEEQ